MFLCDGLQDMGFFYSTRCAAFVQSPQAVQLLTAFLSQNQVQPMVSPEFLEHQTSRLSDAQVISKPLLQTSKRVRGQPQSLKSALGDSLPDRVLVSGVAPRHPAFLASCTCSPELLLMKVTLVTL